MGIDRPLRATYHCRHYSYEGGMKGGPLCAAGVDLRAPGINVLPCMPKDKERPPCDKRAEYTDDERAAWEAYTDEGMKRWAVIMQQMPGSSTDRKNRPEWGKRGEFACPGCNAGTVHWARSSYNGHLRARCTTAHCFDVIE